MRRWQFTVGRLFAVVASIACVLAFTVAFIDRYNVSWPWAAAVAVIVSAPLLLTTAIGNWPDVTQVLIVLVPPVFVGFVNPVGIILAVPVGLLLLGIFNFATKKSFWK